MERLKIAELLKNPTMDYDICVMGWVRTKRDSKGFSFIELNDGSCLSNIQVIVSDQVSNYEQIKKLTTGSSISVIGKQVLSPGKGQTYEIQGNTIQILCLAKETYPLQKKRHTDEYLRTIAHLRPRTNKYGAIFRIRSSLSYAIHQFFQEKGFYYIHTPIITSSDCEGAGELFHVSTTQSQEIENFFRKKVYLTVSGQLSAEMFALALGDVYTFGPTFRAENSNTRRHAAEFWMIEPEMAFCDLNGNMDIAEAFIKSMIHHVLTHCQEDLQLFDRFVAKGLIAKLESLMQDDFIRLPYQEAIPILQQSSQSFEHDIAFGKNLQSEHETFLTDQHFKKPVIIIDYPKSIKPFYMRVNNDDQTVAAMDILVPGIGELIGGSQREERYDMLINRMQNLNLDTSHYWWYLDSRQYGSAPHSGFGLGFERLIMFLTGVSNIRDVIPFPRTPGQIDF